MRLAGNPVVPREEKGDARFAELRDGLSGVEEGRRTVVREHVRRDLLQHVMRREQAEDVNCE